ncbi:uncharacterized protein VTP21DRAFT_9549 [Calcarisporiella thermophila]|uniref:uncharacterized protein n=1 Tax=Calcarisporiella thermophila TaxID=911321 RepID=UPI0037432DEB
MTPSAKRIPVATDRPTSNGLSKSTLVFAPSWLQKDNSFSNGGTAFSSVGGYQRGLGTVGADPEGRKARKSALEEAERPLASNVESGSSERGKVENEPEQNGVSSWRVASSSQSIKAQSLDGPRRPEKVKGFESQFPILSHQPACRADPPPPQPKNKWAHDTTKKRLFSPPSQATDNVTPPPSTLEPLPTDTVSYESQIERLKSLVPKIKGGSTKATVAMESSKPRPKGGITSPRPPNGGSLRPISFTSSHSLQRKPALQSAQRRMTMPSLEQQDHSASSAAGKVDAVGGKPRLGLLRTLSKEKTVTTQIPERSGFVNGVAWATIARGSSAAVEREEGEAVENEDIGLDPVPLGTELVMDERRSGSENQLLEDRSAEVAEEDDRNDDPIPLSATVTEPIPIHGSSSASPPQPLPADSSASAHLQHGSLTSSLVTLSDLPMSESLEREEKFLRDLGWSRPTATENGEGKRKEWAITEEERRWFENVMLPQLRIVQK